MHHHTPNVDSQEISKFSALAREWWDVNGPMKLLHALNPLRLAYVQKHATISGKTVLDLGCGGGILTEALAQSGAIVTGIDMSIDAISIAEQHAANAELSIHYHVSSAEEFAQTHQKHFDVIACMEMLEHVPDPSAIIYATNTMLKHNGLIFFSTINRTVKSFFSAIIGAEYLLNLLPRGTHHFEKFIRPSELTQWAEKNNLLLRGIQGVAYNPLNNTFSLCDVVDTNYLIYFQRI